MNTPNGSVNYAFSWQRQLLQVGIKLFCLICIILELFPAWNFRAGTVSSLTPKVYCTITDIEVCKSLTQRMGVCVRCQTMLFGTKIRPLKGGGGSPPFRTATIFLTIRCSRLP